MTANEYHRRAYDLACDKYRLIEPNVCAVSGDEADKALKSTLKNAFKFAMSVTIPAFTHILNCGNNRLAVYNVSGPSNEEENAFMTIPWSTFLQINSLDKT
jgi:hypothetical protein